MTPSESSRFLISVWPDQPTGPTNRYRRWDIDVEGEWLIDAFGRARLAEDDPSQNTEMSGGWCDLPDELYLRATRAVDVVDRDQVVAFAVEWGLLGRPRCPELSNEPHADRAPSLDLGDRPTAHHMHWREVGVHLAGIQNAATIWGHYSLRDGADGFLDRVEFVGEHPGRPPVPDPKAFSDEETAVMWLSDTLDRALRPYHVRMLWRGPGVTHSHAGWLNAASPGLHSRLMLQLAQHMAEGSAYLTCSSETCRRWYVNQQGRSEHGQHRAGTKYCSASCGQAQANREYRRRQKATS